MFFNIPIQTPIMNHMLDDNQPLIYFIDDETELLGLFELAAEPDFRAMTFNDPREFLEKFKNQELENPDVLVSDLKMPFINGLELIISLREQTEISCPFVLLSGNLSKENLMLAVNNGVEKVLEKPCDLDKIRNGIREVYYVSEIKQIRADVRQTARKIVELSDALEQFADSELPSLKNLLDSNFLQSEFTHDGADQSFRGELHRLKDKLSNLIEQERLYERLQKAS